MNNDTNSIDWTKEKADENYCGKCPQSSLGSICDSSCFIPGNGRTVSSAKEKKKVLYLEELGLFSELSKLRHG